MGLPVELQLYAENLYRRFPEEFIALGMPGLEEVFDLRPRGTWSRRIAETPSEKTVEITIRRWTPGSVAAAAANAGALGGPASMGQGVPGYQQNFGAGYFPGGAPGYPQHQQLAPGHPQTAYIQQLQQLQQQQLAAASAGLFGAAGTGLPHLGLYPSMQSFGHSPPFPEPQGFASQPLQAAQAPAAPPQQAAPVGLDEQTTQRLSRMESALTMLKPQIEAVLAGQAQAKKQAAGGTSSADHAAGAQSPEGAGGGAEQAAGQQRGPGQGQATSEPANTDLRNRRNLGRMQLQINTSPDDRPRVQTASQVTMVGAAASNPSTAGGNGDVAAAGAAPAAVVPMPRSNSEGASLVSQASAAVERRRPPGGISTVRVAPSFMDPASPRSPGFYSAWK